MTKVVEVLIWDYEKGEYTPVRISEVSNDADAMVVGGPFRIDVDGVTVYEARLEARNL